ncbi:cilia-and flagella-associated protein 96-like [Halichondria panicea]|uniref:cilia-and flagella-associated protein 96-like n=1 Tax=Halichondria panicea TaxID=6063 RepID=UPI00312B311F
MAKTDMERVGLFSEQTYTTIGDPYVPPGKKANAESASKGKQMMTASTKVKSAAQDGYFGKNYDRIMTGEAYSDPVKKRRKDRIEETKKNIGKAFIPSSGTKKSCGVGNHHGTLGGPVQAFSAAKKPKPKHQSPGKNFLTNPGKMGTGYGYIGVTIGPTLKYQSEPIDRAQDLLRRERKEASKKMKGSPFKLNSHPKDTFEDNPYKTDNPQPIYREPKRGGEKLKPFRPSNPAKLSAGCHAGTFDPYPKHSDDLYTRSKLKKSDKAKFKGGEFKPSPGPKTTPTTSVLQQNVLRRMNTTNYSSTVPVL